MRLYPQGSETGPKLPYTEASLSYTDDQGRSLFKHPGDVMFHIILTSETLLTNQHPLQYTTAAVSVITAVFAVPSPIVIVVTIVITGAAVSAVTAIIISFIAVVIAITAATISVVSVPSISASNRSLYLVNSVRTWSYYLLVLFSQ
jgi:hypothetical protein